MQWRLKSLASRLFSQPIVQAKINENIKAPRHWLLWGEIHWWWLTGGFPSQTATNAENVSIWSRHHANKQSSRKVWHDDVIKWKHFPRYWPFVWGIHRSRWIANTKGQWRGALMFSLICVWINGWVNNRESGDLRRYRAHYDVIVMESA